MAEYRDITWDIEAGDFALDGGDKLAFTEDAATIEADIRARLISPTGTHWAHVEDGADLLQYVEEGVTLPRVRGGLETPRIDDVVLGQILQDVEGEAQKHRRVLRCNATGRQELEGFMIDLELTLLNGDVSRVSMSGPEGELDA